MKIECYDKKKGNELNNLHRTFPDHLSRFATRLTPQETTKMQPESDPAVERDGYLSAAPSSESRFRVSPLERRRALEPHAACTLIDCAGQHLACGGISGLHLSFG